MTGLLLAMFATINTYFGYSVCEIKEEQTSNTYIYAGKFEVGDFVNCGLVGEVYEGKVMIKDDIGQARIKGRRMKGIGNREEALTWYYRDYGVLQQDCWVIESKREDKRDFYIENGARELPDGTVIIR